MTIVAGSARINVSTPVREQWNTETSVARHVTSENSASSFYGMMNALLNTAKGLDGLTSSTAELNLIDGMTANYTDLNKVDHICTKASVWPIGAFIAPASYGGYIRVKKTPISGSYLWTGIGMTHVYSAWAQLTSASEVTGETSLWPNCPPRVRLVPTVNAATQVFVHNLKTGMYGPGSVTTFGTPVLTHIYAFGY